MTITNNETAADGRYHLPGIGNMPDNGREIPQGYFTRPGVSSIAEMTNQSEKQAQKKGQSRTRAASKPRS